MMNTDNSSSGKAGYARASIPWILIGLALGAVGGAVHGHQALTKNSKYLSQLIAVSEYEKLALLQYKHADTDRAIQSVQDLLNFMNHVEASQLAADQEVLEFDRSLTYMRLALLDEKNGDTEAARKHIAAAAECSKKLRNSDVSESHLRQITAKLDSYLP
jgi:hypothetical protein